MIEATTKIDRKDLALLSIGIAPKLKSNWIFVGVLSIFIFLYLFFTKNFSSFSDIGIAIFASIVGGFVGIIFGVLVNLVCLCFMVDKKSGVLGEHTYELNETGIREKTDVNESFQKWSGIHSIIKNGNYILIQINSYLYHIFPKRDFANVETFEKFYVEAKKLKDSSE